MCQAYGVEVQSCKTLLEQAAAEARAVGDPRLESLALRQFGLVCFACDEYARAGQLFEQALDASQRAGSHREIAWNLGVLASNRIQQGADHEAAKDLLEESIGLGRESGDLWTVVECMVSLGQFSDCGG